MIEPNTIYEGNCLDVLKTWEPNQVDMCITSPPYWGLRNYHHEEQFGQEPTPELYIQHLIDTCKEIKRVLKDSGTCWVNLGDTYSGSGSPGGDWEKGKRTEEEHFTYVQSKDIGVRPKSLVGIPFRFALAMIQDGWILRNTIIWHKPNCMPSSADDRFTLDFEYLFFFSKNERYYFEQQFEVAESQPWSMNSLKGDIQGKNNPRAHGKQKQFFEYNGIGQKEYAANGVQNPSDVKRRILAGQQKKFFPIGGNKQADGVNPTYSGKNWEPKTFNDKQADELGDKPSSGLRQKQKPEYMIRRNKRCVWLIPTEPHPEAHFACYPSELIRTPIKAGCPAQICNQCGKPRQKRMVQNTSCYNDHHEEEFNGQFQKDHPPKEEIISCDCNAGFHAGIVLDPFMGSGTTGKVCQELNRKFVGIELNPEYIKIAKHKLHLDFKDLTKL